MRILLPLLFLTASAYARLGDTQDQLEARYGLPKKPVSLAITGPLLEGATEFAYEYQGWRIRCALLKATDGRYYTVREEYRKICNSDVAKAGGKIQIQDFERDAVLAGEAGSRKWSQKLLADLGNDPVLAIGKQIAHMTGLPGKVWVRNDGAIAYLDFGNTVMTFNLPQALKYEAELKQIKENKAKAAVPKF